jgi:threonine aldolase
MKPQRVIDLRSDTVTRPTPEMRRAMYEAEVGDYYRDDPTVRALEERAAARLGKQAALLVISGTMGNLVSLMAQTRPGQSIVLGQGCHIHLNEAGGLARIAGLTPRTVDAPGGQITPDAVTAALLSVAPINPLTSLVSIENTNNAAGGTVLPIELIDSLSVLTRERGLKLHMDGARLFNAEVALGVPAARIVEGVDTVTFCLSKGLGCPAGAIVAGSAEVVEEARRCRQVLGGGMRQAGVLAAAGLVALESMIERLAEDHENARVLASLLAEIGLPVAVEEVETNMVYFELPELVGSGRDFTEWLAQLGVLVNPPRGRRVRLVTHHNVTRDDVRQAAVIIARCREELKMPKSVAP